MEETKYLFHIPIGKYDIGISTNIMIQWIIILFVTLMLLIFVRSLKKIPGKRQSFLEVVVESVTNLVKEIMGESYTGFVPYVGALGLFLLMMNLTGLVGFEPPTMDYSVALGMAITTFVVIQAFAIRKLGLFHYFIAFGKPFVFLAPMNILERFLLVLSLSLRLFGNIMAAATIMKLIYSSLAGVSWFAQLGIPIPLHFYFDLFDGGIQMVIFTMLTMINIKIVAEH